MAEAAASCGPRDGGASGGGGSGELGALFQKKTLTPLTLPVPERNLAMWGN